MNIKYFKEIKTFDELKKAYRDLMKKWHPDLNPNNQEEATKISKEINAEFEYLFNKLPNERINKKGIKFESKKEFKTPKEYMDIINKIIIYPNIQIDIIGSWLWVSGETKPIKEILKELNFKWHDVRKCWYLKFTYTKSTLCNLNFDELQNLYGGQRFNTKKDEKENKILTNNKNMSFAVTL